VVSKKVQAKLVGSYLMQISPKAGQLSLQLNIPMDKLNDFSPVMASEIICLGLLVM
jgi:hypothetical protein